MDAHGGSSAVAREPPRTSKLASALARALQVEEAVLGHGADPARAGRRFGVDHRGDLGRGRLVDVREVGGVERDLEGPAELERSSVEPLVRVKARGSAAAGPLPAEGAHSVGVGVEPRREVEALVLVREDLDVEEVEAGGDAVDRVEGVQQVAHRHRVRVDEHLVALHRAGGRIGDVDEEAAVGDLEGQAGVAQLSSSTAPSPSASARVTQPVRRSNPPPRGAPVE